MSSEAFWGVVFVGTIAFTASQCSKTQLVEATYPVECKISRKADGVDLCTYRFLGEVEFRANLSAAEVSVITNGRIGDAFKYSDCSIIDASNWACRRVHPPKGNPFPQQIVTTRGRFYKSSNASEMICYPNQIVRLLIKAEILSRNQNDFMSWLLDCSSD